MTDRELLEKAARAAGLRIVDKSPPVSLYIESEGCKGGSFWNPLSDDGDALRLAVKLAIHVTHEGTLVRVLAYRYGMKESDFVELYANDEYAATRRAIVRAAAAIADSTDAKE